MTEEQRKSLKVGDKIRCVEAVHDHKIGKIHTIKSISCGEPLMDYGGGWSAISQNGININAFELVNPEPEFKVGDEVEVLKNVYSGDYFCKGSIVEVVEIQDNGRINTKKPGSKGDYTLSFNPKYVALCSQDNKVQTHKTEDNNMSDNRASRERELRENGIPARKCAVAEAELALLGDEAELKRLKNHKTDYAEQVAFMEVALDPKAKPKARAEATLLLKKHHGITVNS